MSQASHSQLAKLFYRLHNSYKAGIDLRTTVKKETESGSPLYRRTMRAVAADLDAGGSLSLAFRQRDQFFPKLVLAVTQAGERGGRLDDAFRKLAAHYDSLVKFRNRFLASIAWPAFELLFAVGIIGLMILIFGMIYGDGSETGIKNPMSLFGLGAWGSFTVYSLFVLLVAGAALALVLGTARGWFGTLPMRIARRLPLVGKTIESLSLSRFAWTASIAENAGMEAGETMQMALESTQNYYYERLIPEVTAGVRGGRQFHPTLRATNAFPDDFLVLVENGETAGALAETMQRASDQLQETAENNLKVLAVVGFVVCFCFVAIVIGVVVISLFQQVYLNPIQDIMRNPLG